ncbi:peptidoglycan-binding domain-containing protein [Streptomyces sp. CB02923]|uniref:peptidoglycan-binding domain-containing protein n=1 Tax=Streptomyces sp. CB02923 TaxID=1718985 RepID=UPI00093D40F4|nr:peptidoglycan-binding domain-containing protein [Streptomyces sp. CB02923]
MSSRSATGVRGRALAAALLGCALLAGPAVALGGGTAAAKAPARSAEAAGLRNGVNGEWRYCPYTGDHPELGNGHANDAVGHLQCVLNKVYGYRNVATDKIFGAATLAAVKDFQQSVGLTADGFVGPRTWAALHP